MNGIVFPSSVVETHRVTLVPGGERVEVDAQHFVADGISAPFVAYKVSAGKVMLWHHPPVMRLARREGGAVD